MLAGLFWVLVTTGQTSQVKTSLTKLNSDFEEKYQGRNGARLAILEFRTTNDQRLPFNDLIRDEMVLSYQNSQKFKLIDPFLSGKLASENGWSMKTVNSFPFYEKLGQIFMEKTGYVPDLWVYGQIQDNEETITLTAFLVTTGSTDAKAIAAISFPSDELTDRLLNKPVKIRKKENPVPDTVVIEHRIVIEKPADQEPVEPEIRTLAEPQLPASPVGNLPSQKYEEFTLQLTDVRYIGKKLHIKFSVTNTANIERRLYITSYRSRIVNQEGEEFQRPEVILGSSSSSHSVQKTMATDVAMKGELIFSKIPENMTLRLLEIGFQDEKITFKDVPVMAQ